MHSAAYTLVGRRRRNSSLVEKNKRGGSRSERINMIQQIKK